MSTHTVLNISVIVAPLNVKDKWKHEIQKWSSTVDLFVCVDKSEDMKNINILIDDIVKNESSKLLNDIQYIRNEINRSNKNNIIQQLKRIKNIPNIDINEIDNMIILLERENIT